jgi:hypothetical protein
MPVKELTLPAKRAKPLLLETGAQTMLGRAHRPTGLFKTLRPRPIAVEHPQSIPKNDSMEPLMGFLHSFGRLLSLAGMGLLLVLFQSASEAAAPVVGLWRFNEGTGTNVTDSSGFNNGGTLAGENGNVPVWVAGQPGFGRALQFTNNGTDHAYVTISGSASLKVGQTATNSWTITAWAYEISDGNSGFVASYGRILVLDDGDAFQLESGASGDGQLYTWSRQNTGWQIGWGNASSVAPLLDQWVHWAVVYDGTNLTIYRNGNQGTNAGIASAPLSAALGYGAYSGSVLIGSELAQSGSRTWNGMLDDVAIFAGALSQAEVQTIMKGDFSAYVGGPAKIILQPISQAVDAGADASFTVVASGQAPLAYQWYFNGTNLLVGATNATLQMTNVQPALSGNYSVEVTNALGFQLSQSASLVVNTIVPRLVGLWRFNEGSGTNVTDSSGLNNRGTLAGENGTVPAWVAGQPGFGGALRFTNNGTDHAYVMIPASTSLKVGQTATNLWSITAWAYEISDGNNGFVATYGRICVLDDGDAFQLESGAPGDGQLYTWSRQNTGWQIGWGATSSVTPLLDQWVHWAVVYDGTNLTVYRNGNQGTNAGVASTALSAALGYSGYSGSVLIGSELAQAGSRTWNGMIDDVAIFNTALSAPDVVNVMKGDFSNFIIHPRLSVGDARGSLTLSWPSVLSGFQLQSSPVLSGFQWTNVPVTPVLQGSVLTIAPPIGTGTQFFRLRAP